MAPENGGKWLWAKHEEADRRTFFAVKTSG